MHKANSIHIVRYFFSANFFFCSHECGMLFIRQNKHHAQCSVYLATVERMRQRHKLNMTISQCNASDTDTAFLCLEKKHPFVKIATTHLYIQYDFHSSRCVDWQKWSVVSKTAIIQCNFHFQLHGGCILLWCEYIVNI